MNTDNIEQFLDKYYNTILERNDMSQVVITPQYVEEHRQWFEDVVRLVTLYPDYLIDFITPENSYFKLYFYQRLFLRVCMRFREVSGTFPRAFSKSFLDFLAMNIRGIVQPRSKGFTCADTKKQAAQIVEEKTNEVWHDGYYHTGDQATMDEDGYLWYVGRIDDVIKSSGYRIGPFEIESVIMELPYVLECAITPVPDEVRGQIVKATIVLVKGTQGTDELKKEIQEYVKTHTAPYKYPRIVEFVDELPKTISGKIRRVAIRNEDNEKK